MDTCKIAPGLYQYTAVDDCTRYRVLRLYTRRTAANTLEFLDCVMEEMPCPAGPDRPGPRILCSEGSGEIKTVQHQVSSQ